MQPNAGGKAGGVGEMECEGVIRGLVFVPWRVGVSISDPFRR